MNKYFQIFNNSFLSLYIDKLLQTPEYTITYSYVPHTWNVVNDINIKDNFEENLKDIEETFKAKDRLPIFWIEKDKEEFKSFLINKGYKNIGTDIWMEAKSDNINAGKTDLKIEEVTTTTQLEDFLKVFLDVFKDPYGGLADIFRKRLLRATDSKAFVGYINSKPISICGFSTYEDYTTLYSVATLPEFTNKGYAKDICKYAIYESNSRTILLLTEAGNTAINMYKSMGFEEIMEVDIFS